MFKYFLSVSELHNFFSIEKTCLFLLSVCVQNPQDAGQKYIPEGLHRFSRRWEVVCHSAPRGHNS